MRNESSNGEIHQRKVPEKYGAKGTLTLKCGAGVVAGVPTIVNKTRSDRVVWISVAATLAVEGVDGGSFALCDIFRLDCSIH